MAERSRCEWDQHVGTVLGTVISRSGAVSRMVRKIQFLRTKQNRTAANKVQEEINAQLREMFNAVTELTLALQSDGKTKLKTGLFGYTALNLAKGLEMMGRERFPIPVYTRDGVEITAAAKEKKKNKAAAK